MFKIKDNVDLKELEKFGFEKRFLDDKFMYVKHKFMEFDYIVILESTRIIYNNTYIPAHKNMYYRYLYNEEDIQDLIQAGLVEKVEG
jgi:hypothetical protein